MSFKASPQQEKALIDVSYWFKNLTRVKPFYYLGGYAGVGKSRLARHFAEHIDGTVLYAAYTGKASLVMRKMGCDGASTLHSLLYIPVVDKRTGKVTFRFNTQSPIQTAKLIIIDECSMVDDTIGEQLLSFGVPILVLGDPAQLPPIKGAGFFTKGVPDTMLTEIHRQAGDNPIIYLATRLRNKLPLKYGDFGSSKVVEKCKKDQLFEADQVLCGLNKTRTTTNDIFRKEYQFADMIPMPGETLIGLRNDNDVGIINGEMFNVLESYDKGHYDLFKLKSNDEDNKEVNVKTLKYMFDPKGKEPEDWRKKKGYQELAFGYCITCHKSQGSQWGSVYVIDEGSVFGDDWWRWSYTAVTRAAEKTIVYM